MEKNRKTLLREARESRGFSVCETAKELGISRQAYYDYEQGGKRPIPAAKLAKLQTLWELGDGECWLIAKDCAGVK